MTESECSVPATASFTNRSLSVPNGIHSTQLDRQPNESLSPFGPGRRGQHESELDSESTIRVCRVCAAACRSLSCLLCPVAAAPAAGVQDIEAAHSYAFAPAAELHTFEVVRYSGGERGRGRRCKGWKVLQSRYNSEIMYCISLIKFDTN